MKLDLKVLRGTLVLLVLLDRKVLPVMLVRKEILDHKDLRVHKV